MGKTLCQFGEVLFDELEQVAARRGGFASLKWLKAEDRKLKKVVGLLDRIDEAARDDGPVSEKDVADAARDALDYAARVRAATRSVQDLADIARSRLQAAVQVAGVAVEVTRATEAGDADRAAKARERLEEAEGAMSEAKGAQRQAAEGVAAAASFEKKLRELPSPATRPSAGTPGVEVKLRETIAEAGVALDEALEAYTHVLRARETAIRVINESRSLETPPPPVVEEGILGIRRRVAGWLGWRRGDRVIEYPGVLFEMDDIVTDAARAAGLKLDTVGLAFSGGGIRSATFNLGFLQGLTALGLLKKFDYLSTVSGGGYIGSWLAAWIRREGGPAGDPEPASVADEDLAAHAQDLTLKRERTADALENVERQLRTSRSAQRQADRRWITRQEIATGVESGGRPLRRVVDEEPEPVYHLRTFSNYLSPRVGLLSADTWTMVSVYLRDLMLNQFILLPLVLATVLAPRLLLWLFGLDLSRSRWHIVAELGATALLVLCGTVAFFMTYHIIAGIRASRGRARDRETAPDSTYLASFSFVAFCILLPLTLVSLCFAILFAHSVGGKALGDWFYPASLLLWPWSSSPGGKIDQKDLTWKVGRAAVAFGIFVALIRFLTSQVVELAIESWASSRGRGERAGEIRNWGRALKRSFPPFFSGLVSATGLYLVLAFIRASMLDHALLAPFFATFGVPIVLIAIGVGSAIEVGLVGGYEEEDMREWRASLGAYFLMIAAGWAFFVGLSIYGPLLIWATNEVVAAGIAAGWLTTSILGVLAGKSAKTGEVKRRSPMDYLALVAPMVFLIGLLVAVAILACLVQGVSIPLGTRSLEGPEDYLRGLFRNSHSWRTMGGLLFCAALAAYNCFKINVNLFSMNLFYANRLVRCYLGASRPKQAPSEGRPNYAPSHCPVPARRPNPLTGFDPDDDFLIKDLAVVRLWSRADGDLVCDYRGPYPLVNTAMNLVAGSELAWQERMAESFILSPLYSGSQTTGYRKGLVTPDEIRGDPRPREDDASPEGGLVKGYGGDLRLGTAISVSGAAASPNMGYHSSPLVTILLTVFNARLGLWLPNPAKATWRRSGPGFASYLIDELTGRTTDKGRYVYLSDGGHFENLGVYELIRRRCRFIVACDAGADPGQAFWDLGSLVRKCREDLGVRIEIDIAPLLRRGSDGKSQWHCVVGTIYYDDVDETAIPGVLFYVKPSLTGDEPSDIRNYVVEHPDFPHQATADQFFSESQFESYRMLGEHVALRVLGDAAHDAADDSRTDAFFKRLRSEWYPPVPGLDEKFPKSVEPFMRIHAAIRHDPNLGRLSRELYPELQQEGEEDAGSNGRSELKQGGGDNQGAIRRAEIHAVGQMLQVMEKAWLEVNLEGFADNPMNRGWMNVFRRWTSSEVFQTYWPALRGEYSERFVRFCENELNLGSVRVETRRFDVAAKDQFVKALGALDEEFLLEWPEIPWRGQPSVRLGLTAMLDHAIGEGKPGGLDVPAAWLIASVPSSDRAGDKARCYGLILAWEVDEDVIDLMIWLRGAYRTLGMGRSAIEEAIREIRKERLTPCRPRCTLRARYPRSGSGMGKDRWQEAIWKGFFLNQGFHRGGPEVGDDRSSTLVLHWEVA